MNLNIHTHTIKLNYHHKWHFVCAWAYASVRNSNIVIVMNCLQHRCCCCYFLPTKTYQTMSVCLSVRASYKFIYFKWLTLFGWNRKQYTTNTSHVKFPATIVFFLSGLLFLQTASFHSFLNFRFSQLLSVIYLFSIHFEIVISHTTLLSSLFASIAINIHIRSMLTQKSTLKWQ